MTKAEQPVCRTGKPTWRSYLTPAQAAEALGREQHSRRADPKFHNAPFCQAVAPQDDGDRPDRLVLRLGSDVSISDFRENDRVEINGNGVLRRIAAVEGKAIRFQPPLPVRPFREALVWNWKQAVSVVLDLRHKKGVRPWRQDKARDRWGLDWTFQPFNVASSTVTACGTFPNCPRT